MENVFNLFKTFTLIDTNERIRINLFHIRYYKKLYYDGKFYCTSLYDEKNVFSVKEEIEF